MVACLLALTLVLPGLAFAAKEGRLIGKVLDPEGKPIPEVTVTATSTEIPDFRQVETTDKKGVFKFDFPQRFVIYRLRFVKDGFATLQSEQDWQLEGSTRAEFTMHPGESTIGDAPLDSTSSEALLAFNEGVVAFNAKEYVTAESRFLEALQHDPELQQAWAALSNIHLKQEDYRGAVEAAEKAIALGFTDESIWRWRWEGYRNLGDEAKTAEALEDMKRAGLRTEEAEKLHNEAVKLSRAGDLEGAFAKFQEAAKIDPNLQPALLGIAVTGIEIDRDAEAAAAAETVLRTDPRNERALRVRYNAYLNLKDDVGLYDALVGLVAIEPTVALEGLLHLAFAAYDADDEALAKERFSTILIVDPNQPQSHYYLGLIMLNEGNNDAATGHFERCIELAPDSPEAPVARELLKRLSGS
jgi:tetratricopeptide (TPR) repeat protein